MRTRLPIAAVVAVCCLALAFGWWTKARCLPEGWETSKPYAGWCYTDIYPLYYAEGLDREAVPYLDHPVEYPVLTGAQMWAGARVARALPGDEGVRFYDATAGWGALLLLGVLGMLAREVPDRRRLWAYAAAPTLALTAFLNWDALAVALATAAVLAHRRGRDALAGVAAGLGAAAKLFPGLIVPVVVATRLAQGRARDATVHVAAAAGAWLAVNLPVAMAAPQAWWRFYALSRERAPDWDSLWFVGSWVSGASPPTAVVNVASAVLFLGGAGLLLAVGGRRLGRPQWWRLTLPVLGWFLLVSKVYSPQFSLWLLPLLVLAWPGAWPVLAFLVTDLAVFAVRFPFLAGPAGYEPVIGYGWLALAVVARGAALVWVMLATLRGQPSSSSAVSGSSAAALWP